MRKIIPISLFFLFVSISKITAQVDSLLTKPGEKISVKADTLFTRSNEKIPGKVLEIGVTEIKYKKASYLDGPTFIIDKAQVSYIIFASGIKDVIQEEQAAPSSYYSQGPIGSYNIPQALSVLDKNKAIKIEPFSPVSGRIIVGYEQVIKTGFNLEAKVGYINSIYMKSNLYASTYYYYRNSLIAGGFFKGGIKFTFGQQYRYKGEWVKHPLKGQYLRVNALVTKFKVTYDNGYYYNSSGSSVPYPPTNMSISAYGLMGDYGYQFVIGNIITLDMYVGLGFVAVNQASNIPQYNLGQYNTPQYWYTSPNYYSHTYLSSYRASTGIGFNTGFSLGIALK
ncbi:MAG: hypothetical protein ACXVPN_13250 [Bacteroidia bacterium]